jgi:hypothetical protein
MQQQVRGRKRVVLYPPQDADYMYMQGDKSAVLDFISKVSKVVKRSSTLK